ACRSLAVSGRAFEPELVEFADDGLGRGAIRVDEDRARRPAGQGLEAERARAGEQVEHGGPVHRPDEVEDGFPDAVAGRAHLEAFRCIYPGALTRTRDDP